MSRATGEDANVGRSAPGHGLRAAVDLLPRRAVELPGVIETASAVVTAEEHSHLAHRVVRHRLMRAHAGTCAGDLAPLTAVPRPCVGLAVAAVEDHDLPFRVVREARAGARPRTGRSVALPLRAVPLPRGAVPAAPEEH